MKRNTPLTIGGYLSFVAALLHIGCVIGGPDWYRFFGAGEQMAQLAVHGDPFPATVTLSIAGVLTVWGLYALSGAGIVVKLPLLKSGLILITVIYLVRGVAGLVAPLVTSAPVIQQNSVTFWLVSSLICCVYGTFYLLGTKKFCQA